MKVQDIMTIAPACCAPDDEIAAVAEIMARYDVGIVPVKEGSGEGKKLVGVITDRDLCLKLLAVRKDPKTVRVRDCMLTQLTVCSPDDTVPSTLRKMARARVRRLPVVNLNYEIAGIVSMDDVVRMKAAPCAEICSTMASISAPVKNEGGSARIVA